MNCPRCGGEKYRFRLPKWTKSLVSPFNDKMIAVINLLTDVDFKEPDEPCLTMLFTCAQCGDAFFKPEGEPLQSAYARHCQSMQ